MAHVITQSDILARERAIAKRHGLDWSRCRIWLREQALRELGVVKTQIGVES